MNIFLIDDVYVKKHEKDRDEQLRKNKLDKFNNKNNISSIPEEIKITFGGSLIHHFKLNNEVDPYYFGKPI
jgi:hypothetical protein